MNSSMRKILAAITAAAVILSTMPVAFASTTVVDENEVVVINEQSEDTEMTMNETADLSAELLPYQDTSLSFEERAADLVARMTLAEKVAQTGRSAPAISRLGVKEYNYWREGIHGVARQGLATSFPSSLAMSNTWDRQLIYEAGDITSTEARGKNNRYDLSYWNPTINLARDPRWGRNEESYGEDPYLTGQLGGMAVKGMQGTDEKYLKTIATLKHYAANNNEGERQVGTSVMTESTFREYYTRAFGDIIKEHNAASVMSAYNALTLSRNGEVFSDYIASSASKYALTGLLRQTYGFDGYVVGDCGAWENLFGRLPLRQKLYPNMAVDSITAPMIMAKAYEAGNSLDCGSRAQTSTLASVEEGWMSEELLDIAVYRLFLARMKTGEFDDGAKYQDIKASVIENDEHVAKSLEAAEKSWVLLENRDNTLPLKGDKTTNVAVVGGLADQVVLGDYSGEPSKTSTPIAGIKKAIAEINPNATVDLIGQVQDTTPLFNIKSITLVKSTGKNLTVDLSTATNVKGMKLEGSELKDVTKPGIAVVKNVDFSDVTDVIVEASSKTGMPKASVKIGYSNATQDVSIIDIKATANETTYDENKAEYTGASGGYNQTADMYITVTASSEFSVENYKTSLDAADYIIAYAGTTTADSSESNDRESIDLPVSQAHVDMICEAYPEKTIVVMQTVGQINVESFKDKCLAMLWTSYNGQAQGEALGNILIGKANPSGKLSTTWYPKADLEKMPLGSPKEKIDGIEYNFTDYELKQKENYPGRTYQYYGGTPIYPFGYGKSYTTFEYSNITVDKTAADANETVTITADIKNTGSVKGAEVAELYVSVPGGDGVNLPLKQLKGFERVELEPGETKTVTFALDIADVYFFDEVRQQNYVVNGDYTIKVGANANDENALSTTVTVSGDIADTVNMVTALPSGIKLYGAKLTDGTVIPASEITAGATVTLKNEKIVENFTTVEGLTVTYTSSNEAVATVDENGVVKAGNTEGTSIITVTATQGDITVTDTFPVVTVLVNKVTDEVTNSYLSQLDAVYNEFDAPAFTEENKALLDSIYNAAKEAIANELLEANLAGILETAIEEMNAIPKVELEEKYSIVSVNPSIIQNGKINYSAAGIGNYTATETEITGTITKNSPVTIDLKAISGAEDVDTSNLLWFVEKADSSNRTAATIDKATGKLTIYENGVFDITVKNYTDGAYGTLTVYANLQIEAESADAKSSAKVEERPGASGGQDLGTTKTFWLRFDGVKLDKLSDITLRASQKSTESVINISLAANKDRLIGTGTVPVTGDFNNWTEVNVRVNRHEIAKLNLDENGCGTIYIQMNTSNLDYIQLNYVDADIDVMNETGGKIKVTVPHEKGALILTTYNEKGAVKNTTVQEFTEPGEYIFDGYKENEKVKVFTWDSLETMQPIDNAVNHVYTTPEIKTLTLYNFSDAAFDSFFDTGEGAKLTSGTGMDGIGGWATQAKNRECLYQGKKYTFSRGLKAGTGSPELSCVYFTPDADGVVTVLLEANTERCIYIHQGDAITQHYGIGDGLLASCEMFVKAGETVYIYGGGANKSIFGVFFNTERRDVIAPTPTPEPTPEPTQAPLPDDIIYSYGVEFEKYEGKWGTGKMTTSDVASASGGQVVDNTYNNDTFYFGTHEMDDLAAIQIMVGTTAKGAKIEFYAADVSKLGDVASASQSAISALLTSANSLGSATLMPGENWNDFKTLNLVLNTPRTGTLGLFGKCITGPDSKYVGNFDKFTMMYTNPATTAGVAAVASLTAANANREISIVGDIITVTNGNDVKTISYNDEYGTNISFVEVTTWNDMFIALVKDNKTGKTDIVKSAEGTIWITEKLELFSESDIKLTGNEEFVINDILLVDDQLFLGCNDGIVITMTLCSKCYTLRKFCDFDIVSLEENDGQITLKGADDESEALIGLSEARQDKIQSDAAMQLVKSGAKLVDVRTAEEYAEKSVKGSINVPIDKFEEWIKTQSPFDTIIVYCGSGMRAAKAVSIANSNCFLKVYNLGSIDELLK